MLQQTQVDRVLPKYHEWLAKYPSFEALAAADEADVSATWRPLGYNIRPKRLHAIARESVARFGGQLPSDHDTLLSFKGIGAYTAGAIRSFAFHERAAILDTNVARVLFRVFVGEGRSQGPRDAPASMGLSEALVPYKHVFDFNQGLMDLGATVCAPRTPRCGGCPMKGSAGPRRTGGHRARASVRERRHPSCRRRGGRARRLLPRHTTAGGRAPGGAVGVPRRQGGCRREPRKALRREMLEELDTDVEVRAVGPRRRTPTTIATYASLLPLHLPALRDRCSARRCAGCRAWSSARSAFRPRTRN